MKPNYLKKLLLSEIESVSKKSNEYCMSPGKDFTRTRKLSFETVIKTIIGMESKSLTNEMIDAFNAQDNLPSSSAFVQQRSKIKADAFKAIFDGFTSRITKDIGTDIPVLAVDGSDIHIPTDPNDLSSFLTKTNGQKPFNLLHMNALFDLKKKIYTDAVIQGKIDSNEHRALQDMVDRSNIKKALVIADRGYESYNNMAHIQEKGWYFLIRIKDGKRGIKEGFVLPELDEFDEKISLKLTRRQTIETKELLKDKNHFRAIPSTTSFDFLPKKSRKHDPVEFYPINFRIVRFKVTDELYETVLTNLDSDVYPPGNLRTPDHV